VETLSFNYTKITYEISRASPNITVRCAVRR